MSRRSQLVQRIVVAVLSIMVIAAFVDITPAHAASYTLYETAKNNVPVWNKASSSSVNVRTIAKAGTVVQVADLVTNSAGNVWGRLFPTFNEYIFTGNLVKHVHSIAPAGIVSYALKSDTQHSVTTQKQKTYCKCGLLISDAQTKTSSEAHDFVNGKCSKCGQVQVASSPGMYQIRENSPVRTDTQSSAEILYRLTKPAMVNILSVSVNSAGNYWGRLDGSGYIYMGNLRSGFEALNEVSVFLKQPYSGPCTLYAAVMMLRRHAILQGKDYLSITPDSVEKYAWIEGVGLKGEFTYDSTKVTTYQTNPGVWSITSKDYQWKHDKFIELLSTHPEGIVVFDAKKPHAVILLDYNAATDTFYAADSADYKGRNDLTGRIPLSSVTTTGTGQKGKIEQIDKIWYIP